MKIQDNKPFAQIVQTRALRDSTKTDAQTVAAQARATGVDEPKLRPNQGATALTFDEAKIAKIKSAIANGTFSVRADKIAAGLIESVRESLSQKKGGDQ